jgi:FlaA1/EpsC-like NDP-sugar epimerase
VGEVVSGTKPRSRNGIYQYLVLLFCDAVSLNLAVLGALLLRFETNIPEPYLGDYALVAWFYVPASLVVFAAFGLYRRLWRYASFQDAFAILKAVGIATILLVMASSLSLNPQPRSVYILNPMVLAAMVGGSRFSIRALLGGKAWREGYRTRENGRRTLVVGAGAAGTMVLREARQHPGLGVNVIGFVDDDPGKLGLEIQGVPVLGTTGEIPAVCEQHKLGEVLIAIPSASSKTMARIHAICSRAHLQVKTLPGVYELINGSVRLDRIREVQIEDLLGRKAIWWDAHKVVSYLQGKTILVTGAGGSIGSEVCRQALRSGPAKLVMLDHDENALFDVLGTFGHEQRNIDVVIANTRDRQRIGEVFATYRPAVVLHAAAHKHVHFMEQNPVEAVKTNVFGTINVAENAIKCGVSRFVFISTDKAASPSSVMGATKRVAEMAVQGIAQGDASRSFMIVRFGNVLGSRGSVVPLFRAQIARGGPVTITDPEMVRYFMTIPEAVHLVLQAGSIGRSGTILALNMGEPVRIVDLAEKMIRLSGLEPGVDIAIEVIGPRPGERMWEVIAGDGERLLPTPDPRIFEVGIDRVPAYHEVQYGIRELEDSAFRRNGEGCVKLLFAIITGQTQQLREAAAADARERSIVR